MIINLVPTANTFYIVYTDSTKRTFVTSFAAGPNTTGSRGTTTVSTRFALNQINSYTSFSLFNQELVALSQDAYSLNPFTQTYDPTADSITDPVDPNDILIAPELP